MRYPSLVPHQTQRQAARALRSLSVLGSQTGRLLLPPQPDVPGYFGLLSPLGADTRKGKLS